MTPMTQSVFRSTVPRRRVVGRSMGYVFSILVLEYYGRVELVHIHVWCLGMDSKATATTPTVGKNGMCGSKVSKFRDSIT
jgi:hypothetical protein